MTTITDTQLSALRKVAADLNAWIDGTGWAGARFGPATLDTEHDVWDAAVTVANPRGMFRLTVAPSFDCWMVRMDFDDARPWHRYVHEGGVTEAGAAAAVAVARDALARRIPVDAPAPRTRPTFEDLAEGIRFERDTSARTTIDDGTALFDGIPLGRIDPTASVPRVAALNMALAHRYDTNDWFFDLTPDTRHLSFVESRAAL